MNRKMLVTAACLLIAPSLFAQNKEDDRLKQSAAVLQELLSGDKGLPKTTRIRRTACSSSRA